MIYKSMSGALAALAALAPGPLPAADEALLDVLMKNGAITPAQRQALSGQKAEVPAEPKIASKPAPAADQGLLDVLLENGMISQAQFAALQVKAGQDKKTEHEAKASLKDGIKLKSQDGTFQAQIGAYAQLDSGFYWDDPSDFSDATQLRRARISVAGTVYQDWDYKVEADFAGTTQDTGTTNEVTITDAYLRYTGFKPFSFTAGNFKVPFSLEAVSSAKYITFMERGLPFAFLNLRALGGMAAANGDNWTASVGAFGDTVTAENSDDEGKSVASRVTWAPYFASDRVLHLGASGAWREPPQNGAEPFNETVRFRSKPESNPITDDLGTAGRLVDTGRIGGDVEYFSLFGAELAGVYGPLSVQGEYIRTDIDRGVGDSLVFDGYYGYASWFLTGESRNYKADKGIFDVLVPNKLFSLTTGGLGAWEVAARYSEIDLNDDGVSGGRLRDITGGLNWYPNPYIRFMANYIHVLELDGGPHDGEDLDIFQLRAQVAY
jgi:phosphate-selective porin OprO/OprP